MIINYIICIALSFWSTVKIVDLFKHENNKHYIELKKFEKKTQNLLIKNSKGFGTFLGISITLLLSFLIFFFLLKFKIEHQELINRKNTYLCYKNYSKTTLDYISSINKTNIALRALFLAKGNGAMTEAAIVIQNSLILIQESKHVSYLKKINSISYCDLSNQIQFMANLPFQNHAAVFLERNIDSTTILRKQKWTLTIFNQATFIRFQKRFALVTTYQVKNQFDFSPQDSTKEIRMDLLNLKLLHGSVYIFL